MFRPHPFTQPVGRTKVDWSHPILNGISYLEVFDKYDALAGASDFIDNGKVIFGLIGNSKIRVVPGGIALTNDCIRDISTSTYNAPLTGSLFVWQTAGFAPTDGSNHMICNIGGDPHAIYLYKNGSSLWHGGWNDVLSGAATNTFAAGESFSVGLTWSGSGSAIYVKGQVVASNGVAAASATTANLSFAIGGLQSTVWPWDSNGTGGIHYFAIWNRVLQPEEIAYLAADPYGFLIPDESIWSGPALTAEAVRAMQHALILTDSWS